MKAIVTIIFITIGYFQGKKLKQQNLKKELIFYCFILTWSYVLTLLWLMELKLPSDLKGVQYLLKKMGLTYPS